MTWEEATAQSRLQACGQYDENGTFWYLAIEEDEKGNVGPHMYYKRKNQTRLRACNMVPQNMYGWQPIGGPKKQEEQDG